jgi:hypothetical protein
MLSFFGLSFMAVGLYFHQQPLWIFGLGFWLVVWITFRKSFSKAILLGGILGTLFGCGAGVLLGVLLGDQMNGYIALVGSAIVGAVGGVMVFQLFVGGGIGEIMIHLSNHYLSKIMDGLLLVITGIGAVVGIFTLSGSIPKYYGPVGGSGVALGMVGLVVGMLLGRKMDQRDEIIPHKGIPY